MNTLRRELDRVATALCRGDRSAAGVVVAALALGWSVVLAAMFVAIAAGFCAIGGAR